MLIPCLSYSTPLSVFSYDSFTFSFVSLITMQKIHRHVAPIVPPFRSIPSKHPSYTGVLVVIWLIPFFGCVSAQVWSLGRLKFHAFSFLEVDLHPGVRRLNTKAKRNF